MRRESHSYHEYKNYYIYIIAACDGMYYGDVHLNGTRYKSNVKSNSSNGCLIKCENWVDNKVGVVYR